MYIIPLYPLVYPFIFLYNILLRKEKINFQHITIESIKSLEYFTKSFSVLSKFALILNMVGMYYWMEIQNILLGVMSLISSFLGIFIIKCLKDGVGENVRNDKNAGILSHFMATMFELVYYAFCVMGIIMFFKMDLLFLIETPIIYKILSLFLCVFVYMSIHYISIKNLFLLYMISFIINIIISIGFMDINLLDHIRKISFIIVICFMYVLFCSIVSGIFINAIENAQKAMNFAIFAFPIFGFLITLFTLQLEYFFVAFGCIPFGCIWFCMVSGLINRPKGSEKILLSIEKGDIKAFKKQICRKDSFLLLDILQYLELENINIKFQQCLEKHITDSRNTMNRGISLLSFGYFKKGIY